MPHPSPAQRRLRHGSEEDSAIVRQNEARPVLFMSWAYADKPEMTAELAEAYTTVGNANDVLVIPAGLAFARVRERGAGSQSLCAGQASSQPRRQLSGGQCGVRCPHRPLPLGQQLSRRAGRGDGAAAADCRLGQPCRPITASEAGRRGSSASLADPPAVHRFRLACAATVGMERGSECPGLLSLGRLQ